MSSLFQPPAQVTLIHGQRRHVLEKIGLEYQRRIHCYGREMNYFTVDRDRYLAQHPER